MPEENAVAVSIDHVVKRYGQTTVLEQLVLLIRDNAFFTLLGPSGCGKTTLLRMIAGFEEVTEGKILLFGEDIVALPPNHRSVNTVFQNYALFPHMTVIQNVMFGLEMKGQTPKQAREMAGKMLELVQLSNFSERKPSQLSGGQQQRVALARALAPRPKVLLLDEPLSALDLKLRQAMRLELKQLQRETAITFIFVTHDQEEALTMSDHVAVMSAGKIEQIGTAREIYETPYNRFVADFIGETNLIEVTPAEINGVLTTCRLNNGHHLTCPSVKGTEIGKKTHISIRPERIFLSKKQDNKHSLSGIVTENTYMGTNMQIIVRLDDGTDMIIRTQNTQQSDDIIFTPGDQAYITMETSAARLLNH